MSYTRTNWVSRYSDGNIPADAPAISAENLNNIEDGIQESFKKIEGLGESLKEYIDNNILYFSKTIETVPREWVDAFQIPKDVDLSRYIPLAQEDSITNGSRLKVIQYDQPTTLHREGSNKVRMQISTEGMVSFYHDKVESIWVTIDVILLPVKKFLMDEIS